MVLDNKYFDILGVLPNSSLDEIEKAWKEKRKNLHPDKAKKNGLTTEQATKSFQEAHEAYQKIIEEKSKRGIKISEFFSGRDGDTDYLSKILNEQERLETSSILIKNIEDSKSRFKVSEDEISEFCPEWRGKIQIISTRKSMFDFYFSLFGKIVRQSCINKEHLKGEARGDNFPKGEESQSFPSSESSERT